MAEETSKKSQFNAGISMTERIDSLQRALNASRFNLKGFNMETGTFNFEIMINALNGLFHEAWAKLDPAEKKEGDKIYTIVQNLLELFPPIEQQRSERSGNSEPRLNVDNLNKLKLILIIYERKIKEYLDKHNLNSPNKDEYDEGW